jgi:hypothetical protein
MAAATDAGEPVATATATATVTSKTMTVTIGGSNKDKQAIPKTNGTPAAQPKEQPLPQPETMAVEPVELDDFGLPVRRFPTPSLKGSDGDAQSIKERPGSGLSKRGRSESRGSKKSLPSRTSSLSKPLDSDSDDEFKDAESTQHQSGSASVAAEEPELSSEPVTPMPPNVTANPKQDTPEKAKRKDSKAAEAKPPEAPADEAEEPAVVLTDKANDVPETKEATEKKQGVDHSRDTSIASTANGMSEFSHYQLTVQKQEKTTDDDLEWQEMPAYAPYDIYDDDNKLVAKEHHDVEDEKYGYAGLGGAGKGYTRILVDDDAESATSMDENTKYLFNEVKGTSMMDDEEHQRDAVSQMRATKDLLTEGQRIAYVGVTRLELAAMVKDAEALEPTRKTKKDVAMSAEATMMWSQKMMIRLYAHMEISNAEQVMIEQLAAHGVTSHDLTPVLMANARVKNPMADEQGDSPSSTSLKSPKPPTSPATPEDEPVAEPPPPYESAGGDAMPDVKMPSQLPNTQKIDIDLRWTVLCDLFLVLIADSVYDARSRVLLERVGKCLEIPWLDICRFEKRVTDALEMQQQAEKENWNEEEHMENRRKLALKRRYVMMGLATVGGGLVIGLSAGLLAPMIGIGLAAGFTTIGVTGTGSFLAGAGGAAIITSGAAASGSLIGVRAANRRTGAVKTFEYRPLHNNKRVNLIVTVSGWMTGKIDDVRLPYSTVDPVMGDIYSVLWEPEMLTSMGDTINILATEVGTSSLQGPSFVLTSV